MVVSNGKNYTINDKNTLDTQTIEDRINPEILKQFKENPYTQSLQSVV